MQNRTIISEILLEFLVCTWRKSRQEIDMFGLYLETIHYSKIDVLPSSKVITLKLHR